MQKSKRLLAAPLSPLWKRVIYRCWATLAISLVIVAIIFTLFRALTPWVKQYKNQIEAQLSIWTGQTVSVQNVQTSWYWFVPVLRMEHVKFADKQGHALALNHVMVGVDLWHSLWSWQIQPGMLYLNDANLQVKQTDTTWLINGFHLQATGGIGQTATDETVLGILGIVLAQEKIIIKHMTVSVELRNGRYLPIQELNLKIINHSGKYRIRGNARLALKPTATNVSVVAELGINPSHVYQSNGQVYISLQQIDVRQWKQWIPESAYQLNKGAGDIEMWFDLNHGRLVNWQSTLEFSDIAWTELTRTKQRKITSLHANVAWQRQENGWRATADKLVLRMNGEDWSNNELMITYDNTNLSYTAYVKTLALDQVMRMDLPWPASMKKLLALHPTGILQSLQLGWQYGQLNYLLTQFSQLGWQKTSRIPGLTNLSGAVYWQPTEGRLEMDSDHATLTPLHHLPSVTLDTFNAAFDWKSLSNGLRVTMERFVVSHPNLVLSATGAIDNPLKTEANLRLRMDFAAKSAEYWLKYIPDIPNKPEFSDWLKKTGIPHVEHATGRLTVSGPIADFPFDHNEGIFTVDSHLSGANILIDPQWPANQNIDADLHVNHRRLEADVDHGTILDVSVQGLNIVVPDIGLNKEVFLLNGQVTATGSQLKKYVFGSPLKSILSRWQGLTIEESLDLALQLEVPLYPQSDHVFAKGSLTFHDNPVFIMAVDNRAEFSEVAGKLSFNEYGLTSGRLDGMLAGYPFAILVQPMTGKREGTELQFEGEVPIAYINHLVHVPILSFMKGQMIVSGLWTVYPHEADSDKLWLNSSLAGVAFYLPPPLNKSLLDIKPLTVGLVFHPQDSMDLNVDYDKLIQGSLAIKKLPKQGWVETGDIHLGAGKLEHPNLTGLRLSGSIAHLDTDAWSKIIRRWPKESSSISTWESLHDMDLKVGETKFLGQSLQNLHLIAHQNEKNVWSGHVKQDLIEGSYTYALADNKLSMHLKHLSILPTPKAKKTADDKHWDLHPASIPNINMIVDTCQYHGVDIGKIDFKTESHRNHWVLKEGSIITDEYQLYATGDWVETKNKHQTNFQTQVRIKNLSKGLERWKLTPAVDAHSGQADIEANWSAPVYDFALQNLTGQMHLVLKDGRISHLDPETEKKLGLGKVLSILSLQTLPRRLKLDFSDLSEKGYSFDVFKGNFEINQGVMTTHDSSIDGPVAYAKMDGDIDLVKQLYDLNLRLTPYIGASLPVVATIAGWPVSGPIAGIATWAALKVINQGIIQKISAYTYKVSGPWSNPVVQQVSIVRSKNQ